MAITPKVGLSGAYVDGTGKQWPSKIRTVNTPTNVNCIKELEGSSSINRDSVAFVDVGGAPPSPPGTSYFQAIDAAS